VSRVHLQKLAHMRVREAKLLLDGGEWSGAYYLSGYAIEFALKSCVLHYIEKTGILFKDKAYLNNLSKFWTHKLDDLLGFAGLKDIRKNDCIANLTLSGYWGVVNDWNESSRYEEKVEKEARDLFDAVTSDPDGVLKWTQKYW